MSKDQRPWWPLWDAVSRWRDKSKDHTLFTEHNNTLAFTPPLKIRMPQYGYTRIFPKKIFGVKGRRGAFATDTIQSHVDLGNATVSLKSESDAMNAELVAQRKLAQEKELADLIERQKLEPGVNHLGSQRDILKQPTSIYNRIDRLTKELVSGRFQNRSYHEVKHELESIPMIFRVAYAKGQSKRKPKVRTFDNPSQEEQERRDLQRGRTEIKERKDFVDTFGPKIARSFSPAPWIEDPHFLDDSLETVELYEMLMRDITEFEDQIIEERRGHIEDLAQSMVSTAYDFSDSLISRIDESMGGFGNLLARLTHWTENPSLCMQLDSDLSKIVLNESNSVVEVARFYKKIVKYFEQEASQPAFPYRQGVRRLRGKVDNAFYVPADPMAEIAIGIDELKKIASIIVGEGMDYNLLLDFDIKQDFARKKVRLNVQMDNSVEVVKKEAQVTTLPELLNEYKVDGPEEAHATRVISILPQWMQDAMTSSDDWHVRRYSKVFDKKIVGAIDRARLGSAPDATTKMAYSTVASKIAVDSLSPLPFVIKQYADKTTIDGMVEYAQEQSQLPLAMVVIDEALRQNLMGGGRSGYKFLVRSILGALDSVGYEDKEVIEALTQTHSDAQFESLMPRLDLVSKLKVKTGRMRRPILLEDARLGENLYSLVNYIQRKGRKHRMVFQMTETERYTPTQFTSGRGAPHSSIKGQYLHGTAHIAHEVVAAVTHEDAKSKMGAIVPGWTIDFVTQGATPNWYKPKSNVAESVEGLAFSRVVDF